MIVEQRENNTKCLYQYDLPIGKIEVYDDFVYTEFDEGVHINATNAEKIYNVILEHFGSKSSFGYISNRINSYSISPVELLRFRNLVDAEVKVALVTTTYKGKEAARYETLFWPKHFTVRHFENMTQAINWIST